MDQSEMSYSDYLQLDKILDAQKILSNNEHDELLFIVIHQTYELWFKQLLHEGSYLNKNILAGNEDSALSTINRMLTIMKTLVKQVDILETMTPLSFLSFRDSLNRSSGMQSYQFIAFEYFLGFKNAQKLKSFTEGGDIYKQLEAQLDAPSVYDCLLRFINDSGFPIEEKVLKRDYRASYQKNESVENAISEAYRNNSRLRILCEKFVDLDEGVQEWRYRHVKMVERTIGQKLGTGGTLGVEYLKNTLFKVAFPELWSVRLKF